MYQGLKTVASQALAPIITSLCLCHLSRICVVVSAIAVGAGGAGGMGVFRGWPFVIVVVEVTVNNKLVKNKVIRKKKKHTYCSRHMHLEPSFILHCCCCCCCCRCWTVVVVRLRCRGRCCCQICAWLMYVQISIKSHDFQNKIKYYIILYYIMPSESETHGTHLHKKHPIPDSLIGG